jgi:hypothetical protein
MKSVFISYTFTTNISVHSLVIVIQEILLRSLPTLVTCIQEILLRSLPALAFQYWEDMDIDPLSPPPKWIVLEKALRK